jgi:hypothetical protein
MTADEFVKVVRKGSEKLRVDEVTINTGGQELHGKGMLRISRKKIDVEVTVDEGAKLPQIRTGIYTKKDNWKVTGLIEDSLRFKCEHAGMPIHTQWSWPGTAQGGITRCTLGIHPIDLVPTGWDAMTRAERKEFLEQNQTPTTGWGVDKTQDNRLTLRFSNIRLIRRVGVKKSKAKPTILILF